MTATRTAVSVAALLAFTVLAFGSSEEVEVGNVEPADATPSASAPEGDAPADADADADASKVEVSPEMQAFLDDFQGDTEAVKAAVSSRAVDPEAIFDDTHHMVGVNFLKELKNPKVVQRQDGAEGPCYAVTGDEFPDDPDEHTLHKFKICWTAAGISHVEEIPYFSKL